MAAAHQQPGLAARLPEAGVEHVGVARIHHQIGDTRRVVDEQHLVPRLAAVLRPKHAAFGVGSEHVAEGPDVDDVGIDRIDHDARDVAGRREPHVAPRLAAIETLPHAVTIRHVAADRCFATAGPDDVGVALEDVDRADGAAEIVVGHRVPRLARVRCLPHAAAGGTDVILIRALRRTDHRSHAAGVSGTEHPPLEAAPATGVDRCRGGGGLLCGGQGRCRERGEGNGEGVRAMRHHGHPVKSLGVRRWTLVNRDDPRIEDQRKLTPKV